MKRIQFFADRDDIAKLMTRIEAASTLYYMTTASTNRPAKAVSTFEALAVAPGVADADSSMACSSWLLALSPTAIHPRVVKTAEGVNYLYDQLLCEDTVVFRPAGVLDERTVLMGEVATRTETARSREIMKLFSVAFKGERFRKHEGFSVGAGAYGRLLAGCRLTLAVQTPFSVARPEAWDN